MVNDTQSIMKQISWANVIVKCLHFACSKKADVVMMCWKPKCHCRRVSPLVVSLQKQKVPCQFCTRCPANILHQPRLEHINQTWCKDSSCTTFCDSSAATQCQTQIHQTWHQDQEKPQNFSTWKLAPLTTWCEKLCHIDHSCFVQLITAVNGQAINGVERVVSRRSGPVPLLCFLRDFKILVSESMQTWVEFCCLRQTELPKKLHGGMQSVKISGMQSVKMTIEPWEQWFPNQVQKTKTGERVREVVDWVFLRHSHSSACRTSHWTKSHGAWWWRPSIAKGRSQRN